MTYKEKIELLKVLTALYQSSKDGDFKDFLIKNIIKIIKETI